MNEAFILKLRERNILGKGDVFIKRHSRKKGRGVMHFGQSKSYWSAKTFFCTEGKKLTLGKKGRTLKTTEKLEMKGELDVLRGKKKSGGCG